MAGPKRLSKDKWQKSKDLDPLWEQVEARLTPRQLCLLSAACLRHVDHELPNRPFLEAVEVLENHADGQVKEKAWKAARTACETAYHQADTASDYRSNFCLIEGVFRAVSGDYRLAVKKAADAFAWVKVPVYMLDGNESRWDRALDKEEAAQCDLFRDIVPFQPIKLDAKVLVWRDRTVVRLAEAAYAKRKLPRGYLDTRPLAILADALGEAGCTDKVVLSHLRGKGPHVRGCWSLDLALGR